ncbi:anoctamin-7 isoform X4 [Dasypus novemcinctus]|uniref:anoctamin-7 isoform X4 n=1 Tax=Dasypus novemcinctus TaxID=9361 RepID=UPI00265E0A67|nr:anoctamin-7 isoform X4 [Dasypus novemcinctus]
MLQDKHPPTSEAEHNCLSCSAPRAVWLGRAQGRGPLSSQLPTTSVRKQGAVGLLRLRPPPGSNTQGFWVKAGHVAMSSRVRGGRSSRVQRRGDAGLPSSPWPPRGFPRVWSPRGSSGRTRHPCLSVGPGAARGGSSSSAGEHPPRRPAPPQPTHSPWWGPLCGGDRGGKCQKGWGCREPACQGGWDLCTPPMHALRGRSACVCSRVCTCLPRVHLPPACAPASRLCTCLPRVHLPPACAPASRLCTCLPPVHLPPACAPASHVCTSVFSSLPCVPPGASPRVLLCAHLSPTRRFLGSDNQDTFFTSTQRHQILFEILAKTPYGHEKKGLFGIDQLLAQGVFSAAFPLHDGPFEVPAGGLPPQSLNQRQVLRQHWARWAKWCKYQPLDHVRRYFGEKVALYFAWLGFYTGWLLPAAVLGTLVFIGGSLAASSDTPTQELCNSTDRFEMCPLCFDCPFWLLSSACTLVQAGRLFDHGGTVFFSTCMALWAVLLLEYWKRTRATLAYRWDCSDYEDMEERPRPQFAASAPTTAVNPITGEEEPHFPPRSRARRMLAGSVVILMMVAVVIMCLLSVILYRAIMAVLVSRSENAVLAAWASRIASLTGSVVNLVAILILSRVYVGLARVLTRWVRQLLLLAHLRCLLQGQVCGVPRQLPHLVWSPQRGVRGRGLPDGAGAGAPGHHGGQAGHQQRAGDPRPEAQGLVAEVAAAPQEEGGGGPGALGGRLPAAALRGPVRGVPGNGAAVRLRHGLRGRLPARAALRAAQQLGRAAPGRAQVRLRVPAPGGRARPGHRHLVPRPRGHHAPGGRQQRLPAGLRLRLPAARLLPLDPRPRPARLRGLHPGARPARLRRRAQPHVQEAPGTNPGTFQGTGLSGTMTGTTPRPTGPSWPSAWPLSLCLSTWCSPSAGSSTSWYRTSPSLWRSR